MFGEFFQEYTNKSAKDFARAIGTGAIGLTESLSANMILEILSQNADVKSNPLILVRIVIPHKKQCRKFKDAAKDYVASRPPSDQIGTKEKSGKVFKKIRQPQKRKVN